MEQTVNTFQDGLLLDTHPIVQGNKTLSDALNATFITLSGNEVVLLNDMGNRKIPTGDGEYVTLPEGYEPVGMKEYGGVIYIASYNPITDKSLLGSFPSPERAASSNNKDSNISIIDILNSFANEGLTSRLDILNTLNLHNGDKYVVYNDNIYLNTNDNNSLVFGNIFLKDFGIPTTAEFYISDLEEQVPPDYTINSPLYKFSLGVMSDEFVDITEKTTDYIIKLDPEFSIEGDNLTNHQKWAAPTYLEKFSGKLALKTELIVPKVKVDVIPEKTIIPETNIDTIAIYLTLPTEDNVSYWDRNGNSTIHISSVELVEFQIGSYQSDYDWSDWDGNPRWADANHTTIYFQKKILESDTFFPFKVAIFPQFRIPTFSSDGNQIHVQSIDQIDLKSSEFDINASKIGTGDIEIVKWKWYYNGDNSVNLNYLFLTYPLKDIDPEYRENITINVTDEDNKTVHSFTIIKNLNLELFDKLTLPDSRKVYNVAISYNYTLNGELYSLTQSRWILTTALLNGFYNSSIKDFGDTTNLTLRNKLTPELTIEPNQTITIKEYILPLYVTEDKNTCYDSTTEEYYFLGKVKNQIQINFNLYDLKLKFPNLYPEDVVTNITSSLLSYIVDSYSISPLLYNKSDNALLDPEDAIEVDDTTQNILKFNISQIYRNYIGGLSTPSIDFVYTDFYDFLGSLIDNLTYPSISFRVAEKRESSESVGYDVRRHYTVKSSDSCCEIIRYYNDSETVSFFPLSGESLDNTTCFINAEELANKLYLYNKLTSETSSPIVFGGTYGNFRTLNTYTKTIDPNSVDIDDWLIFYWLDLNDLWVLIYGGNCNENMSISDVKSRYSNIIQLLQLLNDSKYYYSFTNESILSPSIYFKTNTDLYTINKTVDLRIKYSVTLTNVSCAINNKYSNIFIAPNSTQNLTITHKSTNSLSENFFTMVLKYKSTMSIPAALQKVENGEITYLYVDSNNIPLDPQYVYKGYYLGGNLIVNQITTSVTRKLYKDNIHYIPSNNNPLITSLGSILYMHDLIFTTIASGLSSLSGYYSAIDLRTLPTVKGAIRR